ncbi:jg8484 [Pararge aegeria aegeria]|uniref:Jg8484 protein n=1 Tax=Pararge aegeria aegeria TaxID=348720 RepID=A0A8S4RYJ4_9NEOP|nr:jg8484 [Pararge aegeria aegeria]
MVNDDSDDKTATRTKPRSRGSDFRSLRILVIEPRGRYCKSVWCAIGIGLAHVFIGATVMTALLFHLNVGSFSELELCLEHLHDQIRNEEIRRRTRFTDIGQRVGKEQGYVLLLGELADVGVPRSYIELELRQWLVGSIAFTAQAICTHFPAILRYCLWHNGNAFSMQVQRFIRNCTWCNRYCNSYIGGHIASNWALWFITRSLF